MKKAIRAVGTFRKHALVVSVASAMAMSMEANAQQTQEVEEISVTGSRIRITSGMATPVPVTVMTRDELTSFNPGGTLVEQMDTLPQFFNSGSSQRGGGILFGPAGGSYLNMRNLGTNRTLILMDGSRLPAADKRGSVNVDMLPTALMRSVDTVTGGASAAYGADALGGVVNFILDRQFEGLKVNVGTGTSEWGDGDRYNFEIAGGKSFGERLNVIGSFNSNEIGQIIRQGSDVSDKEDWFRNWGHVTNPDWRPGLTTVPQRLTLPCVAPTDRAPGGMIWSRVNNSASPGAALTSFKYNGAVFTEDGSDVRAFVKAGTYVRPGGPGSTTTMAGCGNPEVLEYNQSRDVVTGNKVVNRSGFIGAQYQFSENLTGFVQALVGRSESRFRDNRGGMNFTGNWHGTIFRDNAFLAPNVAAAMDEAGIGVFQIWKNEMPRNVKNLRYGRDDSGVFVTEAYSTGLNYTLANDWTLTGSWQHGQSHRRTGVFNEQRVDRTYLAMDAVRHPTTGQIVCRVQLYNPTPAQLAASPAVAGRLASPGGIEGGSTSNPTTNKLLSPIGLDRTVEDCVPLNIMGVGTNSLAAQEYINTPKMGHGIVEQDFAEALLQGDAFEGWGYGPVSFAAGLTYRDESFFEHAVNRAEDQLGPPLNDPDLGIRGIPPGYTAGSPNLHARSVIPDILGGYDVWEWFTEVNAPFWESSSGQQVVGGSAAYRSSNYSNLDDSIDSWKLGLDIQVIEGLRLRLTRSRDVREASFSERFDMQGGGVTIIDPLINNSSYQTTIVSGGNEDLSTETANTMVAGFVYQPTWLTGLSMSADWYDVKVSDSISQLGAQRLVNDCLAGNQLLCSKVQRAPSGEITRIFDVFLNVAQARVRGIDYELAYQMEPNFFGNLDESLSVRALAGYIQERSDTPLGAPKFDISGWLNTPELTSMVTTNYVVGPYSAQLQYRFIDAVGLNRLWVEGRDVDDNSVDSADYFNLRFGYGGEFDNGGTWQLSLDITNVLNDGQPIIAGATQQINPSYEQYGRRYFISLRAGF